MQVRTAKDIGAFIRDRRKKQKLDQAELAEKVGVNRRWVLEVERGKPRAEIGLVLKTLNALGLTLSIETDAIKDHAVGQEVEMIDIDDVVARAKRPKS
ncbi:helix-turn-helix transcriptional regulator [Bradyrhizobium sp. LHD-71]|uniref:helix-turn-helix transcriptional regulator n=1 Tax=Bradyrhizobium sp. LHD-71 TaxID=3072141 RepID=UPI00280C63E9|nr:helix-turn-helix transcriptional regulator [Bradyrhizobium sp. LHD-71]MDQ8727468.1 helix-turn-helix transcriptional regulator [Bradyrhizobium sp. LHD-71]